jgi:hypothetical protein
MANLGLKKQTLLVKGTNWLYSEPLMMFVDSAKGVFDEVG